MEKKTLPEPRATFQVRLPVTTIMAIHDYARDHDIGVLGDAVERLLEHGGLKPKHPTKGA